MRYKPSTFYSNFSMDDLVKRNTSHMELDSASGGGGGCGSGIGGYSGSSGQAHYQKSESFVLHLKPGGLAKTDETKLLSSLKADVHDEIVKTNARITGTGDLEIPCCYVEYSEDGIQGRIEITGKLTEGNYYSVTATLNETSTSKGPPFPSLFERQKRGRQPMGAYYVVPFLLDDPRASQDLLAVGQRIIKESIENVRQRLLADQSGKNSLLQNLEYAEVYVWTPIPPEIKQRLKEAMGVEFEVPAEYEQFKKVYFLNEVALRMYREAGEDLAILKTISANEVAKIPGPSLSGPYVPKRAQR